MADWLSPKYMADELGVTTKTIREWIKSGELSGIKFGGSWRVHKDDFNRYLKGKHDG